MYKIARSFFKTFFTADFHLGCNAVELECQEVHREGSRSR